MWTIKCTVIAAWHRPLRCATFTVVHILQSTGTNWAKEGLREQATKPLMMIAYCSTHNTHNKNLLYGMCDCLMFGWEHASIHFNYPRGGSIRWKRYTGRRSFNVAAGFGSVIVLEMGFANKPFWLTLPYVYKASANNVRCVSHQWVGFIVLNIHSK